MANRLKYFHKIIHKNVLQITYRQLKEQNNANKSRSMLCGSEMQETKYEWLRRPRELETSISETRVVYNCFFCSSK